ncbi:MAG: iron-containing alcohol dehydrogenase, partial [Thermoproteota archaeon]
WYKRSLDNDVIRPKFAIMNPEVTFSVSPYYTACGVADMMAHVMERYFTNTVDTDLTDRLCEATLKTIIKNAQIVLEEPKNYAARAELMWASTIAHNGLLGTGRTGDWASHLIEHELSGLYDVTHGAGLAVIFPAWMKYVYKHRIDKFVQFAARVWSIEPNFESLEKTALEGIEQLKEFFKKLGLPTTLKELNVPEKKFEEIASRCTNNGTSTVGNFVKLSKEDIVKILEIAEK